MYHVAVRKKSNTSDYFWMTNDFLFDECKIPCEDKYWLADPFLFKKDNVTYIFFEAMDLLCRRGKIGYCILKEDGSCSPMKVVIDEPFHLSFPYIFEKDGNIYLMPESSDAYTLQLYVAESFPDKWIHRDNVFRDIYCCDSIIIDYGVQNFLLTNEMYHNTPTGSYPSCWVKNYLYPIKKEDKGISVLNGVKVAEGDYGVRNAGKSFYVDGILYRPGQDCRYNQYGRGLVLFQLQSLVPYIEKEVYSIDCEIFEHHINRQETPPLMGIHTYNQTEDWEIIDYSCQTKLPLTVRCLRVFRHVRALASSLKSF